MFHNHNTIKEILRKHIDYDENSKISMLGGMTNKNFLVSTISGKYVFRQPGSMTSELVHRRNEKRNSLIMSDVGINVETLYLNEKNGIKITRFLDNSQNLTHNSVIYKENLEIIAKKLYKLHNLNIAFENEFNVFNMFRHYLTLLKNSSKFFSYNSYMQEIYDFFIRLEMSNTLLDKHKVPCHNDLVPENILTKENDCYFIDWEYSGMNDPLFDIAAFFLESRLNREEQEFFISNYDKNLNLKIINKKILTHQFTQDVLWFLWTIIKEENNENFDDYALIRIHRAYSTMKKLKNY